MAGSTTPGGDESTTLEGGNSKYPSGVFGNANDKKAVLAYLSGKPLRPLSDDFSYNLRGLVRLFEPLAAWSPWNDRVLGLWLAKDWWWSKHRGGFFAWARGQIAAAPEADAYGAFRRVLSSQRISDPEALEITGEYLTDALFVDGQPTSLARWLEAHFESFDALWKSADERGKRRV